MHTDFDYIIDRRNSQSVKWDLFKNNYSDCLPLWVADTDFSTAPQIIDAIKSRAEHGAFGYTFPDDTVYYAIIDRIDKKYNWKIKKDWIVFLPGVVDGISSCISAFTEKLDKVIIQKPVYHPFTNVVRCLNRTTLNNPLKFSNNTYSMDFNDLECKIKEKNPKMMILCNPHNPIGKAWRGDDLRKLGEIINKNNIIMVSDEIHSDIIYGNTPHTPYGSIAENFENNSVTLMSPSKLFNLAGLSQAFAIIPNETLRKKFKLVRTSLTENNIFGTVALKTAYTECESYVENFNAYIKSNVEFACDFINNNIKRISVIKPDSTYLMWVDMRNLEMKPKELDEFIKEKAKLRLNPGRLFGKEGEGFQRINVACSKDTLAEALNRLKSAIDKL